MSNDIAADGHESIGKEPVEQARPRNPGGSLTLKFYKSGQGYYTRVGTAIGMGVLTLFGAQFVYTVLNESIAPAVSWRLPVVYGVPTALIVILGAVTYWVVGLNRTSNDFFIATEGEMKKVNWSTRQEVITSTKVVIIVVVLMAAFLFVFDIGFMLFFYLIKVLKVGPPWMDSLVGSDAD